LHRAIEVEDGKSLYVRNGSLDSDSMSLVQSDDPRVECKVIARPLGLSTIVQEISYVALNFKPKSSGVSLQPLDSPRKCGVIEKAVSRD
jgi:hypothetical protein